MDLEHDHYDDGRAEVLAWMRSTGHGYKIAARRFGVPVDVIRSWARPTLAEPGGWSTAAPPDLRSPTATLRAVAREAGQLAAAHPRLARQVARALLAALEGRDGPDADAGSPEAGAAPLALLDAPRGGTSEPGVR